MTIIQKNGILVGIYAVFSVGTDLWTTGIHPWIAGIVSAEYSNFKGSRLEKQMILYCKQLQIDSRKLPEEEFRWFIRILKKSKLYKGGGCGKK